VALGILKKHAGNKWDCRCVEALEAVLGEGEEVFPFA
jgi:HD-GYP domain-containing protein (c-di-GMP phosphodiesterase class II)